MNIFANIRLARVYLTNQPYVLNRTNARLARAYAIFIIRPLQFFFTLAMEHQKCYIFKAANERPAKRRRVEESGLQSTWKTREEIYRRLWTRQEQQIQVGLMGWRERKTLMVTRMY